MIQEIKWFSLENIKKSPEVIYPVVLPDYLPDIVAGRFPKEPIGLDLAKKPIKKVSK